MSQSENGVVFTPSKERVSLLQADQILQSELFSLDSLYSPKVEERLVEFRKLRSKFREGTLSEEERIQYDQLDLWASQLPMAATEEERSEELVVHREIAKNQDQISELE